MTPGEKSPSAIVFGWLQGLSGGKGGFLTQHPVPNEPSELINMDILDEICNIAQ